MKTKAVTTIMITLFLASMLSMAFVAPIKATPDSDIVGLWHFDEGTGSTAADLSGNANHGTLSGGKFGNALCFDGVDDYVEVPDSASLDITGDITLEAWILINDFSTSEGYHMYIVSKDSAGQRSYGIGVDLTWNSPKKPFFIVFHAGGSYKIAWGTNELVKGAWYHIAGVFDALNDKLTLYVNGVIQQTVIDTSTIYAGSANLWIGAREYAGHRCFFNGLIDEARVSNIVRYTTGFTAPTTPFTIDGNTAALWHFDESVGDTAYDSSGNDNDGTIHGAKWAGPTWTTGLYGDALHFDGVDDYVKVPDSDSLDITEAITIECWVRREQAAYQTLIAKWSAANNQRSYLLSLTSDNRVRFWTSSLGTWGTLQELTSFGTIGTEWTHISATYDGTTMKIYINGVKDANEVSTVISIFEGTAPLMFGVHPAYITHGWVPGYFKGLIDEVCIWNKALSADEIKVHAGICTPEWLPPISFKTVYKDGQTVPIKFAIRDSNGAFISITSLWIEITGNSMDPIVIYCDPTKTTPINNILIQSDVEQYIANWFIGTGTGMFTVKLYAGATRLLCTEITVR